MTQKNITYRVKKEVADGYSKLCQHKGIVMSKEIESFMAYKINTDRTGFKKQNKYAKVSR